MQHWVKVALLIGALFLLTMNTGEVALSAVFQPDPFEPNDTPATATPIELPFTSERLAISPRNDFDFFVFELTETSTVTAEVTSLAQPRVLDPLMALVNENDDILGFNDDANGLDPALSQTLPPGRYFIVIGSFDAESAGTYSLNVFVEDLGNCISSTLSSSQAESWELGTLDPGTDIRLTLIGPEDADFDLFLHEVTSLNPLFSIQVARTFGEASNESINYTAQATVSLPYLVSVRALLGSGAYTLCWTINAPE